jgi:hypothetical protein
MEGEEEGPEAGVNSEIRYITLELMKLAQKSGKSFGEIANEYLDNACKLQEMITGEPDASAKKKGDTSNQQR